MLIFPNHYHHLHHSNVLLKTERKQVIPPNRYVEADLVTYALNVAEVINSCEEPFT